MYVKQVYQMCNGFIFKALVRATYTLLRYTKAHGHGILHAEGDASNNDCNDLAHHAVHSFYYCKADTLYTDIVSETRCCFYTSARIVVLHLRQLRLFLASICFHRRGSRVYVNAEMLLVRKSSAMLLEGKQQ